jgi:hypothetical protein
MKLITSSVVRSLATVLIGCGTLAGNLQAQSDSSVTVSVPFPFTVGTQSIAPGTYQFRLLSSQFLLSVLNVKTGAREMFAVHPERQSAFEQQGRAVFHSSEGRSALSQIYFPGSDTFSEVSQRHEARRLEAKRSSTDNTISVAQR